MLRTLTLREFRAFRNHQFSFSKINIFAGKNNSGKSSVMSAINLLAQTIKDRDVGGPALLLNGQYEQLGTYIDVVHGNIARRPIGIDIIFDDYDLSLEFKYRTQRRQIELQKFELKRSHREIYKYTSRKDAFESRINGKDAAQYIGLGRKVRPTFRNFWPINFIPIDEIISMDHSQQKATIARDRYISASRELSNALSQIDNHFSSFESISAFRDRPSRTYLYTGETAKNVGITGSNTAQILAQDAAQRGSGKGSLAEAISDWFRSTGIAKGLSVKSLTSRHFEISVVSNDGSEHNICDVGFGCSQVLPVLLGGLRIIEQRGRRDSSILTVQEPEIHLHPNAQAELGTFFVDVAKRGVQVFIETHSDNLILRIASHVASGRIQPDDIAIFWVGDDEEHTVESVSITEVGTFSPSWPGGFFPQRSLETTNLARQVIRRSPQKRLK